MAWAEDDCRLSADRAMLKLVKNAYVNMKVKICTNLLTHLSLHVRDSHTVGQQIWKCPGYEFFNLSETHSLSTQDLVKSLID